MSAPLGDIGKRQDLLIRQGATYGPVKITITNHDLTGCVVTARIKKTPSSVDVIADFEVTITAPALGTIEFGLGAQTTSFIPAGESLRDRESAYVWDMELIDTLGRVTALFYGDVQVFRDV